MRLARAERAEIPVTGLILYLSLISVSAMGITAADWADHLILIPLFGMLGGLMGAILARSLFSGRMAALLAAAYGLWLTGWQFGNALSASLSLRARIFTLLARLSAFSATLSRGEESKDALIPVLIMAALFWAFGCYGAWSLFRRKDPWGVVLPAGLLLLVNSFYYVGEIRMDLILAVYLALTIVVLVYRELTDRRAGWRRLQIRVRPNVVLQVTVAGAIVGLLLVSASWLGPALARSDAVADAWEAVSGPWQRTLDRMGDAVAGFRSSPGFVEEFDRSLTLRGGSEPRDEVVMRVVPIVESERSIRLYWRARTYDQYRDGRWTSDGGQAISFSPQDGPLQVSTGEGRDTVEFEFTVDRRLGNHLYVPPQPIWVDRSASVQGEQYQGDVVDVSTFLTDRAVLSGRSYRAVGSIAVPTTTELREAGTDYPGWVVDRYHQVPDSITGRMHELAQRIAGELPTPYEKTAAITAWLRANIEYEWNTTTPPVDREALDWFIFDYRVGFCNYYASAEVIMLRTLGVPARLATGYAQGTFFPDEDSYEVSSRDYHAWPEVYFPGIGWVEFEPTPSQAPLLRPEGERGGVEPMEGESRGGEGSIGGDDRLRLERMEDLMHGEDEVLPPLEEGTSSLRAVPAGYVLPSILAVLIVGILLWTRVDAGWRLAVTGGAGWLTQFLGPDRVPQEIRLLAEHDMPASGPYLRWIAWWPRLGLRPERDQTPSERAALFERAYPDLARRGWALASAYEKSRFAGRAEAVTEAEDAWRALAPSIWMAWMRGLGRRFFRGLRRWVRRS